VSQPIPQLRIPLRLIALTAAILAGVVDPAWSASWGDTGIGAPLLRSYTARDTGTLAPYRCTLRTNDGLLYVAHDGLLQFDGETWRPMPLPENVAVRALAEGQNGCIWVGGDNLLGTLTHQPDGTPLFTSMLSLVPPEHRRDLGSISALFVLSEGSVVAVTENRVYRLRSGGTQVWSLPAPRRLSAWRDADGTVFVVQPGSATLRVTDSGLEPAGFPAACSAEGIEWCVRFNDGACLIGTGHRLLRLQGERIDPVAGQAADLLREDQVTAALPMAGGYAALATLRHGILILDSAGRQIAALNRNGDMPDNRVEHLSADKNGCIAATTPGAIVLFCNEVCATLFDSRNGLSPKRTPAIVRTPSGLFLADGKQILHLVTADASHPTGFWQVCTERTDRVTALLPLSDRLVACSPGELTWVTPSVAATISLRSADIVALGPWSAVPAGLAWIEGSHFCRGTIVDGQLRLAGQPLEIDSDACSLAEDATGAHWIATNHSSVIRVAPADQIEAGKPPSRIYRSNLGGATATTPRLFRVGSRIMVTTETGLAMHSEVGDRFLPFPGIVNARIHAISATEPDGTVWLALSQRDRVPFQIRIARLRPYGDGVSCELVRLPPIPFAEPPSAILAEPGPSTDERIFWLGLTGRVVRIESPGTLASNPPVAPTISALTIFDDPRGTHPIPSRQPKVDFDNAGLRFDVSVPDGRLGQRVHLEARLVDFDNGWVPLGDIPSRVFRGLRDRPYRFEARSIDALGRPSAVAAMDFTVLPPWWRSAPAFVAYALGLVLFSALIFLTRLRLARVRHRELEALVAQRTRQLAEANAAKSEFLAHINHEIRNPLNGVIGLSAMLANQHQDENSRHLARSLKACAGYLGSVVDNVLDLARIEAGRIEITPQRFDPRQLIEDIAEMFRLQIEETGGRITWSSDPDLPAALVGDVHRIRQVLVNFTANAARYARGGDIRISVRRRSQAKNRIATVFTVADTGPGIAPAEQDRIFEKFTRGSAAGDTESTRGYGVGLALVRDLAELLGGEADVDSQLGFGAKFRLTIPLEIAAGAAPANPPAPARNAQALRVLVIDDQAFNRVVLRDQLERLGCKVEEAADGPSALLLLQASAHHMAFIDLDLPGLDGIDLLRRIRSDGVPRPIFLVATTASATCGIEEKVLAAGADAFLPKPISFPHLAELLDTCTARLEHRAAATANPPARPAEPTTPASLPTQAAPAAGGLFASLPLTPDMLRMLHAELDVETQSLASSWRLADSSASRHHAHRIASLGIIARDEFLTQAARRAEESLQQDRGDASQSVDALQLAARTRIQVLATDVAAHHKDAHN
jgi:signal transduction histidine kinase/CheY-like chemotaxis protein